MSIKSIDEALRIFRYGGTFRDGLLEEAEAQVARIREVASALPVPGIGSWDQPEWDRAVADILALMRSIAKEGP